MLRTSRVELLEEPSLRVSFKLETRFLSDQDLLLEIRRPVSYNGEKLSLKSLHSKQITIN